MEAHQRELFEQGFEVHVVKDTAAAATTPDFEDGSSSVSFQVMDNDGGRSVRVRGGKKVTSHLMFGILALTVVALGRLAGAGLNGQSNLGSFARGSGAANVAAGIVAGFGRAWLTD